MRDVVGGVQRNTLLKIATLFRDDSHFAKRNELQDTF